VRGPSGDTRTETWSLRGKCTPKERNPIAEFLSKRRGLSILSLPALRRIIMGAAPSSANASCAQLCADGAEPQELCAVTPCEWDRGGACQSTMTGCECPQYKAGLATSALPPFLEDPVGAMIIACGPLLLVTLTIAVVPLMLCTPWQRTSALPRSLSAVTPATLCAWILLCALVTLGLMTAEHVLPPTVWGECAQRVCVYHMMFCEATRHGSAVRHPANFWSSASAPSSTCARALPSERVAPPLGRPHPPNGNLTVGLESRRDPAQTFRMRTRRSGCFASPWKRMCTAPHGPSSSSTRPSGLCSSPCHSQASHGMPPTAPLST